MTKEEKEAKVKSIMSKAANYQVNLPIGTYEELKLHWEEKIKIMPIDLLEEYLSVEDVFDPNFLDRAKKELIERSIENILLVGE